MSQPDWTVFDDCKDAQNYSGSMSVDTGFGIPFVQVIQNDAVLACAKNYLHLCENLPKEAAIHSTTVVNVGNLPNDLLRVERGVEILCAAYVAAIRNQDERVCHDVKSELASLSGFYQKQVAKAYFSACNILLDADDVADKPDVLKQLKQSRNALQEVHCLWPVADGDKDLTAFFEKVNHYGCQLGIDGRVYPEKKAGKVFVLNHFSPKIRINGR